MSDGTSYQGARYSGGCDGPEDAGEGDLRAVLVPHENQPGSTEGGDGRKHAALDESLVEVAENTGDDVGGEEGRDEVVAERHVDEGAQQLDKGDDPPEG